jgi:hypothetical protein
LQPPPLSLPTLSPPQPSTGGTFFITSIFAFVWSVLGFFSWRDINRLASDQYKDAFKDSITTADDW